MTDTGNTVQLYMGCGRYVPGALAVATECLCVLGRIRECINSWVSVHPIGASGASSLTTTIYVLLDGRGAGWRVVGNALRAVHVRVKFFLRHRFPWKFPETVFFRASQISERISGNLDQSQSSHGQGIGPRGPANNDYTAQWFLIYMYNANE